jgi:hypothetical protein
LKNIARKIVDKSGNKQKDIVESSRSPPLRYIYSLAQWSPRMGNSIQLKKNNLIGKDACLINKDVN